MSKDIILTGVKPTGRLHLGNLVGAVRPIIEMSKKSQTFVFIADLHALNAIHDPKLLREYVIQEAATFLALGLDPQNAIFFCQSDVPQVAELSTLLMNITPKGLMNRAHSYKAMMDKNREKAIYNQIKTIELQDSFDPYNYFKTRFDRVRFLDKVNEEDLEKHLIDKHKTKKTNPYGIQDIDLSKYINNSCIPILSISNETKPEVKDAISDVIKTCETIQREVDLDNDVNMGLYTYPVLMAADILLYNSDIVPVGKDQKQHLEFARDIAGYFNNTYGEIFKLPKPFIQEETGIIPGLDGRKMSKSYNNQIAIFDTEAELKKKIMRIVTDSKLPNELKNPDESAIFLLYRHFADKAATKEMRDKFINGEIGYGDAKKLLFEAVNDYLAEPRKEYERLMKNPDEIREILKLGADRARAVAAATTARVKKAMGLNYFE